MKVYDISSFQGKVDINKVALDPETYGFIFRTTIKAGTIDSNTYKCFKFAENAKNNGDIKYLAGYKFAYSREYMSAFMECMSTLLTLHDNDMLYSLDHFYVDLEDWSGRPYTTEETNNVIKGYLDACYIFNVRLGLYFNLNYLKNIVNPAWRFLPLWIARYNKELGDTRGWRPWLWQYTSDGIVDGIEKRVDVNEVLYEII